MINNLAEGERIGCHFFSKNLWEPRCATASVSRFDVHLSFLQGIPKKCCNYQSKGQVLVPFEIVLCIIVEEIFCMMMKATS
jgi:hypothetical protein